RKPNLKFQLDSTLIQSNHIPIFASWIDKKESSHYNIKNIPYDFKLLYRSSQNGVDAKSFHRNCDNKGATIVVAKVKNSEQIIGGYNPLQWDSSNSYKSTNDSFIFSFANRSNFQSAKVGYVINNSPHSIYCNSTYGPTFGGGHDLYCQNNGTWSCHHIAYSYP